MPSVFDITLNLQTRGPTNLRPVISDIQRQLNGLSATIDPKINPSAARHLNALTSAVSTLNAGVSGLQNSARGAQRGLQGMSVNPAAATNAAKLGAGLKTVAKGAKEAGDATGNATKDMQEFGRQTFFTARRFASFYVVVQGLRVLERSIGNAVTEGANFQREMVRIAQVGGGTASAIRAISQEIGRLSTTLGADSAELAKVAVTLRQAGLSASDTRTEEN